MEYKVLVTTYSLEKKLSKLTGGYWDNLKLIEDILNGKKSKKDYEGFKLREIIPTPMGNRIVYTLVLEKE